MRKLNSVLLAPALAAVLAACAGSPISQGGKAEIVFARSDTIRIRWDPRLTNERDMRSKAIAFCSGRNVHELDASTETGASGLLQAKTWSCDNYSGTGSGM